MFTIGFMMLIVGHKHTRPFPVLDTVCLNNYPTSISELLGTPDSIKYMINCTKIEITSE